MASNVPTVLTNVGSPWRNSRFKLCQQNVDRCKAKIVEIKTPTKHIVEDSHVVIHVHNHVGTDHVVEVYDRRSC